MPVPTPITASGAGTNGAAADGGAPDGAAPDGAAPNGVGSNGAGSNGAGTNGAASNGASADGLTSAGAMKDRLLRVLLADPARALRAVDDLESSKGQLDQLHESMDVQREQLAGAARRLRQAGLSPAQVARLAGGSGREITELLGEPSPSDPRTGAPAQSYNN
jgi:hypothetical protein